MIYQIKHKSQVSSAELIIASHRIASHPPQLYIPFHKIRALAQILRLQEQKKICATSRHRTDMLFSVKKLREQQHQYAPLHTLTRRLLPFALYAILPIVIFRMYLSHLPDPQAPTIQLPRLIINPGKMFHQSFIF